MTKAIWHYIFLSIIVPIALVGCVADKGASKDANCGAGQVFDVVARRCVASQGASTEPNQPPVPLTSTATINEDSLGSAVALLYSDIDGDLATSCSIVSYDTFVFSAPPTCFCSAGFCYAMLVPDANMARQTSFTYNITEPNDGTSANKTVVVNMVNINDAPSFGGVLTVGPYVGIEDTPFSIAGLPTATDIDCDIGLPPALNAINANCPPAITYLLASYSRVPAWSGTPPTFLGNILRNCMGVDGSSLDDISCDFHPEADFSGTYQFVYEAKDTWGNSPDYVTVNVTINGVNDQPQVTCGGDCKIVVPEDGVDAEPQTPGSASALTFEITNSGLVAGVTGITHTFIDTEETAGLDDISVYDECVISNNTVPGLALNTTGVGSCELIWDVSLLPLQIDQNGVTGTFDVSFCDSGLGEMPIDVECSVPVTVTFEVDPRNDTPTIVNTFTYQTPNGAPAGSPFQESIDAFALNADDYPYSFSVDASLTVDPIPGSPTPETLTYAITGGTYTFNGGAAVTFDDDFLNTSGPDIGEAVPFLMNCTVGTTWDCLLSMLNNNGNIYGTIDFDFEVTDDSGASDAGTFQIEIESVDDAPVICQYSRYFDARECGLGACRGTGTPQENNITPTSHTATKPVVWYDESTTACYVSQSASTWAIELSSVPDQEINEKDILYIRNIVFDQGGSTAEDAYDLDIVNVNSSNTVLIQNNNIFFNRGDTPTEANAPYQWSAGGTSGDSYRNGYIKIVPTGTTAGTSTIDFDVVSNGVVLTHVQFDVKVNATSIQHNGWKNIMAAGPTINKYGEVKSANNVCSFSRDQCNGGNECTGVSSPTMAPDDGIANAIYWASGSNQCYYYTGPVVVNEQQTVTWSGAPVAGSFRLSFSGAQTAWLAFNATAATVQTALESLGTIGTGNVTVLDAPPGYQVEFVGSLSGLDQPNIIVSNNTMGVTGTFSETQAATGAAPDSWQPFSTSCPITASVFESSCNPSSSANCMGDSTPAAADVIGSVFYNTSTETCHVSNGTDWTTLTINAPGEAKIAWEDFIVSGSGGIDGYWIYRRVAGGEYNYDFPINKVIVPNGTTFYLDNATNSWNPPLPNVAYYYEVRPVVNGIPTKPVESYAQARLIVPNDNQAFMSRRIANKLMCAKLFSPSDKTNENRCAYVGPGDSDPDNALYNSAYYDIGRDLIVDRFEAGCAYSLSACDNSSAGTTDSHCIGMVDPNGVIDALVNTVFYARNSGRCYINVDGATTWQEYSVFDDPTDFISRYTSSELAPLVRVTQTQAVNFCNAAGNVTPDILGHGGAGGTASMTYTKALPSRKQQMAYTQWDTTSLTDTSISTIETGLSLNSTSKCNASNASGLTGFTDTETPDSSSSYAIPGTASSMIRSVATGSDKTAACQSFAGVQDAVGNVGEWVNESFSTTDQTQIVMFTGVSSSAVSGVFRLTFGGEETANIAYNATPAAVQTALEALTSIGAGNVSVILPIVGLNETGYQVTFTGALAGASHPLLIVSSNTMLDSGANDVASDVYVIIGSDRIALGGDFATTVTASVMSAVGYRMSEGPTWPNGSLSPFAPCNDTDADDSCDGALDSWALEDRPYDADRFFIPMGLPVHRDFNDNVGDPINTAVYPAGHALEGQPVGTISSWAKVIGQTSGITTTQLHGDTVNFNETSLGATGGGMVAGGNYTDGSGAGLYRFELQDESGTSVTTGFRCLTTIPSDQYAPQAMAKSFC